MGGQISRPWALLGSTRRQTETGADSTASSRDGSEVSPATVALAVAPALDVVPSRWATSRSGEGGGMDAPSIFEDIHAAEGRVLRYLTTEPYEKRLVRLPSGTELSTLSVGARTGAPTLVVLHGWGAGGVFFGRNLSGLARHFRVHVVDWPGFGASSRPPFNAKWDAVQAECFFVDALREWADVMPAVEKGFPRQFYIAAHSLGAYLSVAFALREPARVTGLVLASPVGVPRAPAVKLPVRASWAARLLLRAAFAVWDAGYTPQHVIRLLGPYLGRRLAHSLIETRLVVEDDATRCALVDYFYRVSTAPCSGEMSLSTILESGAYAKRPLRDRLPSLTSAPVTFIYGDRDWMSLDAATDACRNMSVPTEIVVAPRASHHLYFDNPDFFNDTVIRACNEERAADSARLNVVSECGQPN